MAPLKETDCELSRRFYAIDTGVAPVPGPSRNIAAWLATMRALDSFVAAHGELPRRKAHPATADASEQRLARWMTRQRAAEGDLCSYQDAALSLIPGFRWWPRKDQFDANIIAVAAFRAEHDGRMPRIRSADPVEHSLALWCRRQREAQRPSARDGAVRTTADKTQL
jgi:hypothetical protein